MQTGYELPVQASVGIILLVGSLFFLDRGVIVRTRRRGRLTWLSGTLLVLGVLLLVGSLALEALCFAPSIASHLNEKWFEGLVLVVFSLTAVAIICIGVGRAERHELAELPILRPEGLLAFELFAAFLLWAELVLIMATILAIIL